MARLQPNVHPNEYQTEKGNDLHFDLGSGSGMGKDEHDKNLDKRDKIIAGQPICALQHQSMRSATNSFARTPDRQGADPFLLDWWPNLIETTDVSHYTPPQAQNGSESAENYLRTDRDEFDLN